MISAKKKKKRIVDVKESTRKPTGEYESSLNPHTSGIDPSFWQFLCVGRLVRASQFEPSICVCTLLLLQIGESFRCQRNLVS